MAGTNWTMYDSGGVSTRRFLSTIGIYVDQLGKIYITDYVAKHVVRMDDMNGTNWTTIP